MFAALLVGGFFAVFTVITWIAVFGEMGDITDRRTPTSGGEIAALGLMLLIASAPVTLFLFRRRLTWRRPRDVEQSLAQSLGWVVVLIVFAVIAFGGWFGVTIENIDRLDLRTRHAFNDTLGTDHDGAARRRPPRRTHLAPPLAPPCRPGKRSGRTGERMTARPSLRPLRAAILLTGMGWIVAAIAVAVSVAVTGNFLFESAPAPGAPETVLDVLPSRGGRSAAPRRPERPAPQRRPAARPDTRPVPLAGPSPPACLSHPCNPTTLA